MSPIPQRLRDEVVARAEDRCEYCRIPAQGQIARFQIDHVTPRSSGGVTILENLALACPRCNGHKWAFESAVDPESGNLQSLFNPRLDVWTEHFGWADDGSLRIVGKSGTGRASIARLNMNSVEVLKIRGFLAELGVEVR